MDRGEQDRGGASGSSERERLTGFIRNSRRVQRRLVRAGVAGLALAAGLTIAEVDRSIVLGLLLVVGMVVAMGFWITTSHIAEWNERLREIDRTSRSAAPR